MFWDSYDEYKFYVENKFNHCDIWISQDLTSSMYNRNRKAVYHVQANQ